MTGVRNGTKQRILNAALVRIKSGAPISARLISHDMGFSSSGAMFRHFKTTHDLYVAVVRQFWSELSDEMSDNSSSDRAEALKRGKEWVATNGRLFHVMLDPLYLEAVDDAVLMRDEDLSKLVVEYYVSRG